MSDTGGWRVVGLAAVIGPLAVGCSSSTPTPTAAPPVTTAASPAPGTTAELDLDSGATNIDVRATDLGGDLDRVTINPDSGDTPVVTRSGDVVHVSLRQTGTGQGASTLQIDLDPHVRWVLHLNGGATVESVDMRTGELAELDVLAGAYRLDLQLGPPTGVVPVRFTGGATQLSLHLPSGVGAQVDLASAIPVVMIDGARRTLGSPPQVIDVGDASAGDRYTVDIDAGLSALSVDNS